VTVGGESAKVKPNGENSLKSFGNWPCTLWLLSTFRRNATTPDVIGFPLYGAVEADGRGSRTVMAAFASCDL